MKLKQSDWEAFQELIKDFDESIYNKNQEGLLSCLRQLFGTFDNVDKALQEVREDGETFNVEERVRASLIQQDVKMVKELIHDFHELSGQEIATNQIDLKELLRLR